MPSARKRKANEKRSRQSDVMSHGENVQIMLTSYLRESERIEGTDSDVIMDSGSRRPQQNSNLICEDFRSLLNTNCRERSEMKIETSMMISEESSNQITRRLNEVKSSLNPRIQDAISTAIVEKVLPSFQNTLVTQGRGNF